MRYQFGLSFGLAALLTALGALPAVAQDFALQVGPAVAGNAQPAKTAMLVVRPAGCDEPARAQITATAEGIVNGARRSVPLKLSALPTSGVHAIHREWPNFGVWIVNLVGQCADKTAGAIVSMGGPHAAYHREAVKYFPHPATPSEIDASLKALAAGSEK
ncbi:MAG: hypothetical protein A3G25_08120 [Betaproteobacteria bacterium RIFCSPLOWO2_12_FULL_63_13]|nr:MAG: hypothetical protein A3G25_08120 [Betaproteobacteria bacterium RIFCSPLOWO2_12_FULL_63_13]